MAVAALASLSARVATTGIGPAAPLAIWLYFLAASFTAFSAKS